MTPRLLHILVCVAALFSALFLAQAVDAQEPTKSEPTYAWQPGPFEAQLGDQATLKVPEEFVFLGPQDAQRLLKDMGNFPSGEELGLVAGGSEGENWFVVIRFIDAGYVQDDDAADWDAEEMLASIKEGTEEANAKRRESGISPLTIRGWEEKPHYDKANNKVVWAISADQGQEAIANYNTLALGRHGYMSMNLVADLNQLSKLRNYSALLLSNLNFVTGKRYADFNSTTDKVAAVGLAALVAGAAFKSGLLAKLLVLLIAFKKVIVIGAVGIAAWVWKLVKGRSSPKPNRQSTEL
ncbi:MAG: DUF2167 domain-containing protein [Nitrospira sp.]|nr:DUF2167 domain-containing protein [Nitrospira sp.]